MPKGKPVVLTPILANQYRGAGDPAPLLVVGLDAVVGATRSVGAASLAGRLSAPRDLDPSVVTTDTMTITNTGAATINGRVENANSENFAILGRLGAWVSGATDVDGAYTGREFYSDGSFEFSWKARGTDSARFWIFVDGVPTTSAPFQPAGTTTAGLTYYQKVVPVANATKIRRYTVLASRISAWGAFRFVVGANVEPTPPRPIVSFVGASFDAGFTTGNNTTALQALAVTVSRYMNIDVQVAAQESTGFLAPGATQVYGDPARIARAIERKPEMISFMGSGNDLGFGTLAEYRAAVRACFNAYAVAAPDVPFVVFGIPPRDAVNTLSADMAARNQILREESIAHPSVFAFHDMIGMLTGTPPAAWSSGTAYGPGDRVQYQGSIWEVAPHVVGTASNITPGTSERWRSSTWAYTGTGKVGTTTGDGTRDTLLSADGTHPEVIGFQALARRVEAALRADLTAAVN